MNAEERAQLAVLCEATRQASEILRQFAASVAKLAGPLRLLTQKLMRAPCPTCDGRIIITHWDTEYSWCRCRRRWAHEDIARGMRR